MGCSTHVGQCEGPRPFHTETAHRQRGSPHECERRTSGIKVRTDLLSIGCTDLSESGLAHQHRAGRSWGDSNTKSQLFLYQLLRLSLGSGWHTPHTQPPSGRCHQLFRPQFQQQETGRSEISTCLAPSDRNSASAALCSRSAAFKSSGNAWRDRTLSLPPSSTVRLAAANRAATSVSRRVRVLLPLQTGRPDHPLERH